MCSVAAEVVASGFDQMASALDWFAHQEPLDLTSTALGDEIASMAMLRNRLDAEFSRRVAVFDRTQGFAAFDAQSTTSWLRRDCRLSPNNASEQVRVARQLTELPETSRAFAAGELGFQHAQTLTRVLEEAPAEVAREAEPELVNVARRFDPQRLSSVTRHLRHTFAPESVVRDEMANRERRRLHLSQSEIEGLYYLDAILDTETGAMLRTALDSLMGPPAAGDERSWAQRRHDAFDDLLRRQLDSGTLPKVGGQRPHITLTGSIETMARVPGSKAADMDWGQPVSGEMLRRIACDSSLTCILVDNDGDPLSVGRTSRTFTPAQRKALILRDRGCVLCGRPAVWTSCHHLVHWIDGGETSVNNGCLLCTRCHTKVHEGGYRLIQRLDRTWTVFRDPIPP